MFWTNSNLEHGEANTSRADHDRGKFAGSRSTIVRHDDDLGVAYLFENIDQLRDAASQVRNQKRHVCAFGCNIKWSWLREWKGSVLVRSFRVHLTGLVCRNLLTNHLRIEWMFGVGAW